MDQSADVLIIGAGPAGCAAALALRGSGARVVLLDRHAFPRDKVCGDAIGGRVERVLTDLDPAYGAALRQFAVKTTIHGCRVTAPNARHFELLFQRRGYASPRLSFDDFLYQLVATHTDTHLPTSATVRTVVPDARGVTVTTREGTTWRARLVIGADGAQSAVARVLGHRLDRAHHGGGVRAYFRGVRPPAHAPGPMLEFFFLRDHLPGYCWIFPLPDDTWNVGFGMVSRDIAAGRVDLRGSLARIVRAAPGLRDRFQNAELLGPTVGFGLPFGSRRRPLSGQRLLLAGDAASLVDPASGEGIGNAVLSGQLAGAHARAALAADHYDADCLRAYDRAVYAALGDELRKSYWVQRALGRRAWLINALVSGAAGNGWLRRLAHQLT